jgi:uncharacterized protein (TIGR02284 family)
MAADEREAHDMNRDPITDEPGAHPVGVGAGATGGAVTGAAVGAIGGPVGMAVGGVVGAVVGGLAGKRAAEAVNPTAEEAFWRDNYKKESYVKPDHTYDDYAPAYNLGVSGRTRYEDDWATVEPRLASEWDANRGSSRLDWTEASHASRAAWHRADSQVRGTGTAAGTGAGGIAGAMQTAGNNSGDMKDTIDVLQDLVECSKDGEYGFRECAEQAKSADLKAMFTRMADECRQAAQELNDHIRRHGGTTEDGGSAMGAMHRGWVSIKSKLTTYDDKAVLTEAERGEDNAKARYKKALEKNLPADCRTLVERQYQGVMQHHDRIKQLRDSTV